MDYKYEFVLSPDLRYGTADQRKALLRWINCNFQNRRPTTDELLAECMNPKSELYGLIETDKVAAAERYWRNAAKDVLRHVNLVRIELKTNTITGPVVAYTPPPRGQYGRTNDNDYIPTRRVMNDPTARKSEMERACDDVAMWCNRAERYAEFFQEFGEVVEILKTLRKRLLSRIKKIKKGTAL